MISIPLLSTCTLAVLSLLWWVAVLFLPIFLAFISWQFIKHLKLLWELVLRKESSRSVIARFYCIKTIWYCQQESLPCKFRMITKGNCNSLYFGLLWLATVMFHSTTISLLYLFVRCSRVSSNTMLLHVFYCNTLISKDKEGIKLLCQ